MDHTRSHMAPYEGIIQSQKENFTSNIEATSIRQLVYNCYDRTPLFPPMQSKRSSYTYPAAQHNDHSQMCHNRKIIGSNEQTTKNTYTSVINELITIRVIEQNYRQRYSMVITSLLICLNTYIYSKFLFQTTNLSKYTQR